MSANAFAVSRRTPRSSKQIRTSSAVASVTYPLPWWSGDRHQPISACASFPASFDLGLCPRILDMEVEVTDHRLRRRSITSIRSTAPDLPRCSSHSSYDVGRSGIHSATSGSERTAKTARRSAVVGGADGEPVGTSGPGDPVEGHAGHPLDRHRAGQRGFAAPLLGEDRGLDPVHPAQVAVQGAANGAALDPHPDLLHHPERGGVVGERPGDHAAQARGPRSRSSASRRQPRSRTPVRRTPGRAATRSPPGCPRPGRAPRPASTASRRRGRGRR